MISSANILTDQAGFVDIRFPCEFRPLWPLTAQCLFRGASSALDASSTFFLTCLSRFSQSIQLAAHFSPVSDLRALSHNSSSDFSSRRAAFRSFHLKQVSIRFNPFSG